MSPLSSESPLSGPKTRIVGFDINHDEREREREREREEPRAALAGPTSVHERKAVVHNESPTSILEVSSTESPSQASLVSSDSKISLTPSSREDSSATLSNLGYGESPPKSHLAEELKRHASLNLDNAVLDAHVKQALPRLKTQRN
jgi:hypothetical protein